MDLLLSQAQTSALERLVCSNSADFGILFGMSHLCVYILEELSVSGRVWFHVWFTPMMKTLFDISTDSPRIPDVHRMILAAIRCASAGEGSISLGLRTVP